MEVAILKWRRPLPDPKTKWKLSGGGGYQTTFNIRVSDSSIVCFDLAAMEYTGDWSEFGNFQMNPTDEVPIEISNSNEELLNTC